MSPRARPGTLAGAGAGAGAGACAAAGAGADAGAAPAATEPLLSRGRTITETDVVLFAGLTGDRHPLHVDEPWARESEHGGRIAHGALVLAYAIGLLEHDVERTVALRGVAGATFKAPVRIGDTIRVEARRARVRPLDARRALAEIACRVLNQHGRAVARFSLELVERRDPEDREHGR